MDRLIVHDTQPMLDAAQESISVRKEPYGFWWCDPRHGRGTQRVGGARGAQLGVDVTVNELQVLRGELDVDHATRAGLEIVRRAELGVDAVAQRGDRLGDLARVVRGTVDGLGGESRDL